MKTINKKLPKKFKEKWIKALRSGNYKQGANELYTSHTQTFCCIGVAGDICKFPREEMNRVGLFNEWADNVNSAKSYKIPQLLIGSNDKNDEDYNPIVEKLAKFNDDKKSFSWIAGYIKRYL